MPAPTGGLRPGKTGSPQSWRWAFPRVHFGNPLHLEFFQCPKGAPASLHSSVNHGPIWRRSRKTSGVCCSRSAVKDVRGLETALRSPGAGRSLAQAAPQGLWENWRPRSYGASAAGSRWEQVTPFGQGPGESVPRVLRVGRAQLAVPATQSTVL